MLFLYAFLYAIIACIIARVIYVMVDEDDDCMALVVLVGMLWPFAVLGGGAFYLSKKPAEWVVRQIRK